MWCHFEISWTTTHKQNSFQLLCCFWNFKKYHCGHIQQLLHITATKKGIWQSHGKMFNTVKYFSNCMSTCLCYFWQHRYIQQLFCSPGVFTVIRWILDLFSSFCLLVHTYTCIEMQIVFCGFVWTVVWALLWQMHQKQNNTLVENYFQKSQRKVQFFCVKCIQNRGFQHQFVQYVTL